MVSTANVTDSLITNRLGRAPGRFYGGYLYYINYSGKSCPHGDTHSQAWYP